MKIYTSYFYQVRNMNKNILPFSTAIYDPKWFHDFREQSYSFTDKKGVINGLRAKPFVPGKSCQNLCKGREECNYLVPGKCKFLRKYEEQLFNLDYKEIVNRFNIIINNYKLNFNINDDVSIALLVHEAPTNKCSERVIIQKWLKEYSLFAGEFNYF